ncbi:MULTISPECIES: flavin reductase family protein [Actinosynnema]|uniref:flavin reductase family protein n=1 Tax=Actinosynnema TaxID=40566 RepID=UPI0020A522F0|nr:flavin reductase family protein [Actinosynnema pretiosum]MCP2097781.1 NADH-FMN oxidoreductase RutF, flavin reductase (DIM6/NTAB) family [Actinosynnema pretiosum]
MSTPSPAALGVEPLELRRFLGNFPTGVTVVTCRRGDVVHGATVNAFTSVSLAPPLVLTALDRRSRACGHLAEGAFVVNVLGEAQRDVALHFAGRPMAGPVPWVGQEGGRPRLDGVVGHLFCRVWRNYDGGDHVLHVAEVEALDLRGGRPLLFHRGEFPRVADGDPVWSQTLDGWAPQFTTR